MRLVCHHCGSDNLYVEARTDAYEREDGTRFLTNLQDAEPDCMSCGDCGVNLKLHRLFEADEAVA